ncbi:MAG: hypothetical protein DLM72_06085, partial [Candidatus Nitrosopolaris wilkensis]
RIELQTNTGAILDIPRTRATFVLIFSHLVDVESKWNVTPLATTRFAFRNHMPAGDCLARISLSWTLLSISVSLVEPPLPVIVLEVGL